MRWIIVIESPKKYHFLVKACHNKKKNETVQKAHNHVILLQKEKNLLKQQQ